MIDYGIVYSWQYIANRVVCSYLLAYIAYMSEEYSLLNGMRLADLWPRRSAKTRVEQTLDLSLFG